MGASGNMLMAALYELLPDKSLFCEKMNRLRLPGVEIIYSASIKCGITGTHISVKIAGVEEESHDEYSLHHNHHDHDHDHDHDHNHDHDHDHEHDHDHHHNNDRRYSYKEILTLIQSLDLPDNVKDDAAGVYMIIGQAEAKVHGTSLDEIHFHEVGSIDAVVDVVGCSLLVDMLGLTEISASPIHVGFGKVRCEHGILPVPAPATAEILQGIPIYSGHIEGELCTPTGAALLKHFTKNFGPMPVMSVNKIGYGMGTKDFPAANCLRAFLYVDTGKSDTVFEISCNLDDMTAEGIGAAFDILLKNEALDVYTTSIMMKKNRPGTMLSCLCKEDSCNKLAQLMIKHTTTLGVRIKKHERIITEREIVTVKTQYGEIRIKKAKDSETEKYKPEYDDVNEKAMLHNVPFQTVYNAAMKNI